MKKTTLTILAVLASAATFATGNTELNFKLDPAMREKSTTLGQSSTISPGYGKTLWGPTGLIFIPTAFVTSAGQMNWGAAFSEDFNTITFNYGLVKDVEVGVGYLDRDGGDNKLIANAKLYIVPANLEQFRLAVGVMDVAHAVDQSLYVVGSIPLVTPDFAVDQGAIGLIAHVGIGSGYFDGEPFFGAELYFAQGFSLAGEWDTKNFNLGLRYDFNPEFSIQVGSYSSAAFFKFGYTKRF
ncbi:MAG: hypothetical protein KF824_13375 [Fimbriimonadaceae bacterium]|nr:MAG: hypothetical protein KF824_13375 [Fimbriimonadaceae bacterium]